jgi:hypothetical protein
LQRPAVCVEAEQDDVAAPDGGEEVDGVAGRLVAVEELHDVRLGEDREPVPCAGQASFLLGGE